MYMSCLPTISCKLINIKLKQKLHTTTDDKLEHYKYLQIPSLPATFSPGFKHGGPLRFRLATLPFAHHSQTVR